MEDKSGTSSESSDSSFEEITSMFEPTSKKPKVCLHLNFIPDASWKAILSCCAHQEQVTKSSKYGHSHCSFVAKGGCERLISYGGLYKISPPSEMIKLMNSQNLHNLISIISGKKLILAYWVGYLAFFWTTVEHNFDCTSGNTDIITVQGLPVSNWLQHKCAKWKWVAKM